MNISSVVHRAYLDIKRNPIPQAITISIVALITLIMVIYALISINLERFIDKFSRELAIIVFLRHDIDPAEVPNIFNRLNKLDGVKEVRYISPEEALKRLEENLQEERMILSGITPKYLPASFEIELKEVIKDVKKIEDISKKIEKWEGIDKVLYGKEWLEGLSLFSEKMRIFFYFFSIFLFFTTAFVVTNTVRLIFNTRIEEVEIMRLIGATNTYILSPFLLLSFLQGFIGSILGIIISLLFYRKIVDFLYASPLLRDIKFIFIGIDHIILLISMSVIFCLLGTFLALRKSLEL